MKRRSLLLVSAIALLWTAGASADDDCDTCGGYYQMTNQRYANYVGAAAGLTTGYGLSVRKWFTQKWGAQLVLFPFIRDEKYPEDSYWSADGMYEEPDSGEAMHGSLSLGIVALRNFADMKYLRFMGYAGGNVQATYENYDYYVEEYTYTTSSGSDYRTVHKKGKEHEEKISVGAGAGVEFYVWRFAFNIMLGVVGGYRLQLETYSLTPSVDAGMFFRF